MRNKKSLNILIIPSWYPSEMDPNGVPFIRTQAQALARAGHRVTVVFTQPYSLKTVLKQKQLIFGNRENFVHGVREILSYLPKSHIKRLDEVTRLTQGKNILKRWTKSKGKPDIVHIHTYLAGMLGVWYSKKYHVPLVTTEHYTGFARGLVKNWELKHARKLYLFSSLNLAVSGSFASLLQKKSGADFDVLPNMVNTEMFSLPTHIKNNNEIYTYLFVGSLHEKKNPLMLLEAFIALYKNDNSIRLILAGEGEMSGLLKSIVKKNRMDNAVTFPGFLNGEEISILMKEVDSFILPSRFETFGIVVIEAMASGLPVIVTRSGGPESFVEEGIHGHVIDQNKLKLIDAMNTIRRKKWNHELIRKYVINNFSEKAVITELENRYNNIIDNVDILQASREISVSGGISKVAYQLALQLTSHGYSVTTITTEQDELSSKNKIGRIHVIPVPAWMKKLPPYLNNYFKTRFFARYVNNIYKFKNRDPGTITISHRDSFGANIAIGHSCHRAAIEIKKREGHFFWWINPIHSFYLKEEKLVCKKPFPALVAISTSIANEYHEHYRLPQSNIHTIPNGVDINRFIDTEKNNNKLKLIEEFWLPNDAFVILFVGNEFKRKGLSFILDSLSFIKNNSKIHLFVLGGADKSPYLNKIENLNITERVHFTGRRNDAPYFFSAADIFILPANYEPFGLVGIEALSSGTPILAPKLGGFLDYLKDGINGYYIKRDEQDIADKISILLNNKKIINDMSKAARESALEYSWSNISQKYSALVDEVIIQKRNL